MTFTTRKELADAVIDAYNKNLEEDFASVIVTALNQR